MVPEKWSTGKMVPGKMVAGKNGPRKIGSREIQKRKPWDGRRASGYVYGILGCDQSLKTQQLNNKPKTRTWGPFFRVPIVVATSCRSFSRLQNFLSLHTLYEMS